MKGKKKIDCFTVIGILMCLAAIGCFIYFSFLMGILGPATQFNYFWLIAAVALTGLGLIFIFAKGGLSRLPKWLLFIIEIVVALGCAIFIIVMFCPLLSLSALSRLWRPGPILYILYVQYTFKLQSYSFLPYFLTSIELNVIFIELNVIASRKMPTRKRYLPALSFQKTHFIILNVCMYNISETPFRLKARRSRIDITNTCISAS